LNPICRQRADQVWSDSTTAGATSPQRLGLARRAAALLCLVALLACALATPLIAQTSVEEYDLKAAYLYQIARFVSWPDTVLDAGDPEFVITVLGEDRFDHKLEDLLGHRNLFGRPIHIVRCAQPEAVGRTHVLFVATEGKEQIEATLRATAELPVLVIGDRFPIAQAGGAMNFYLEDGAVRFEVNPAALERAGLHASSKLLSLARIHEEEP